MKKNHHTKLTVKERVTSIIKGETPNQLPFIDRMELWYRHHSKTDTMPERYAKMGLNEIHKCVGMGRQKFTMPVMLKLKGVELKVIHNGEPLQHEMNPVYQEFPANNAPQFIPREKAGDTVINFITPRGRLRLKYTITESMAATNGVEPYLIEHLIKDDADYEVAEYILEKSDIVSHFEKIATDDVEVGDNGFVVSRVHRIPFQQALLEYLGEIPLFTALYENKVRLNRLIQILDEQVTEMIKLYEGSDALVVQFPDNLDGVMTNPNLFKEFCLPHYQKYADLLHAQNKKMCSHVDGNLKPLLNLLPESGLDIYESFSPWPLTDLRFEEAWKEWSGAGIIWGGIPSPVLEKTYGENAFKKYVNRFLKTVSGKPIIIGIGDQVMPNSLIERVEYISQQIEQL